VRWDARTECLWLRIDPPLIGQAFGLRERDIDQVVVCARLPSVSMFPIRQWPMYVEIARFSVDAPEDGDQLQDHELTHIMYGELYRTEQEARVGLDKAYRQ
jgi:hypothetical protein